jgi:hypothetical protein
VELTAREQALGWGGAFAMLVDTFAQRFGTPPRLPGD